MALRRLAVSDFRCLREVTLEPHPALNLVDGPNASGKTSLLEAIFYLGTGRSFRAAGNRELVRTGTSGFTLFGKIERTDGAHRAGVEVEAGQRRIRVDGEQGRGADLARLLPVQAIDPDVHNLVQGGPDYRRRFLDWGVFHVKHDFLETWRRFQLALRQRNAALRHGEPESQVAAWDGEFVATGEALDTMRQAYLDGLVPLFDSIVNEKLPFDANCVYNRGWDANVELAEALHRNRSRDRALGATQAGPHRADLAVTVHERRARHRVSRGQQKLLAATLVIAQLRFVEAQGVDGLVLLVDDPAAELDRANRALLLELVASVPAQRFVAALDDADLPLDGPHTRFHVEHGDVESLL